MSAILDREEYIEQAYLFRVMGERLPKNIALQELFRQVRDEILATTKLPFAIDYLLAELSHSGVVATAMGKMPHYFHAFQTYIFSEAEQDSGRFDVRIAVEVLRREAEFRTKDPTPQGIFFFQFETLCRNRLRYDPGLTSISQDPVFDERWQRWIMEVRHKIGIIDLADMIYVASEYYRMNASRASADLDAGSTTNLVLFGEKEGRIALANRRKDPLYLFSALQRHLGYPEVPRPQPRTATGELVEQMARRLERLETRLKLMEDEQRNEAVDLTKFYQRPDHGV